jgi:hypothetical protein
VPTAHRMRLRRSGNRPAMPPPPLLLVLHAALLVPRPCEAPPPARCDLLRMGQMCQSHPPPKQDAVNFCANPCVKESVACAGDRQLGRILSVQRLVALTKLANMCNEESKGGRAGDGICQSAMIAKYHSQLDAQGKTPECGSDLTRELFDCVDNPMFAATRREILTMRAACRPGFQNKPGDGVCDVMAVANYNHAAPAQRRCDSPALKEMMDCIDDPLMAKERPLILQERQFCQQQQQQLQQQHPRTTGGVTPGGH